MNRKIFAFMMTLLFLLVFTLTVSAGSYGADTNKQMAELRQFSAKYHKGKQAINDGYELGSGCVPGMGYHYVNFAEVNDEIDPMNPEVLVYEPMKNGKLKLVAVEYMSVGGERPSLYGQEFEDGPFPGSYTLHAWIWKTNSDGLFNPINPKVTGCGVGEH